MVVTGLPAAAQVGVLSGTNVDASEEECLLVCCSLLSRSIRRPDLKQINAI